VPRGGRRVGAGRKPKNRTANVLQHPSSAVRPPSTNEASAVEEFDAPNDLAADERLIWLKQAPFAFANRTLTRATALAFERYCKLVVLERNEAKSSGMGGPNHRGLVKQINALELQFLLAPAGKAMPGSDRSATPAADPDDAFFGGASVRS
jgi:hypothetical protein